MTTKADTRVVLTILLALIGATYALHNQVIALSSTGESETGIIPLAAAQFYCIIYSIGLVYCFNFSITSAPITPFQLAVQNFCMKSWPVCVGASIFSFCIKGLSFTDAIAFQILITAISLATMSVILRGLIKQFNNSEDNVTFTQYLITTLGMGVVFILYLAITSYAFADVEIHSTLVNNTEAKITIKTHGYYQQPTLTVIEDANGTRKLDGSNIYVVQFDPANKDHLVKFTYKIFGISRTKGLRFFQEIQTSSLEQIAKK